MKNILLDIFKSNVNKLLSGKDLAARLKISRITLRALIKEIRNDGYWLIAFNHGYMLTTNKTWLKEYIDARRLEIDEELSTLEKMGA